MMVNERRSIRLGRVRIAALLLALIQIGAAYRAVAFPPAAAPVSLSAPLEFVAAGAWALLFGGLALRPQAGRTFVGVLIAFALYHTARLLIFTRADYDAARLPFALVAIFAFTSMTVFYLMRPALWRGQVNGDDV